MTADPAKLPSESEIDDLFRAHGGQLFGAHQTHATISETKYYEFLQAFMGRVIAAVTRYGPHDETLSGYDRLWNWFSLSRASFLTVPRVLMHEMPDDWQMRMAALLEEYDATFPNRPNIGSTVRAVRDGRLVPMPPVLVNYRHPLKDEIKWMRK